MLRSIKPLSPSARLPRVRGHQAAGSLRRVHLLAVLAGLIGLEAGHAQISYTGGVLAQDFDTLPATGTFAFTGKGPQDLDQAPISASGASGWSIYARAGTTLQFRVDAGESSTASCYAYGVAGDSDRALGSLAGSAQGANLGWRLVNNTGQTITSFTVTYRGEQWRNGGSQNANNKLDFAYRITSSVATGIDNASGYVFVTALDFPSPSLAIPDFAVNGNTPAFSAQRSATISGVSWGNGQLLILRWRDMDDSGADDGLAIDDVLFCAGTVPAAAPAVWSFTPGNGQTGVLTARPLWVAFNQPVTVAGNWVQFAEAGGGSVPVSISGGPVRYQITPAVRLQSGQDYTLTIQGSQVANSGGTQMADNAVASFATQPGVTNLKSIGAVQGSGASTPLSSQVVTVRGVVTGDFQGAPPALGGFFVQSLPAEEDGNSATSDGLYVDDFTSPGSAQVAVGDVVWVTGTAGEDGSQTQLTNVTSLVIEGTAALPGDADALLPMLTSTSLEPLEGMRVRFPQTLAVTSAGTSSNFAVDYARNGELILAVDGPLVLPSEEIDPNDDPASGTSSTGSGNVAAITAQAAANARRSIVLDDGSAAIYPDPTPYLNAQGTRRCGDTVTGLAGILAYSGGRFRVHPAGAVNFVDANPRPAVPPAVSGRFRVAAMNVLNYFTTFGGTEDRGASNYAEFQRQKDKVLAALSKLDAEVLGLIEIQNSADAVSDVLGGLNGAVGTGTYAAVAEPDNGPGSDGIRTLLLYQPAKLRPVGPCRSDNDSVWNTPSPLRYPQAQLFEEIATGERFIACLNHWKSKSSSGATGLNADKNDGQGAWNSLRKQQAARLHAWLQSVCATAGDNDVLILGDLNANGEEDPLDVLRAAGYADQGARFHPGDYSYRLGEERGRLDHAFASGSMAAQVLAAEHWHINADEPSFCDYNVENKSAAQQAINVGTPYRSSDHDPVLIGISLTPQPTTYAMWGASVAWPAGADTQPGADPDGDGMTNLQEFAQHSDPAAGNPAAAPVAEMDGATLRLHFRRRATAEGVGVQPEWSDDLVHWYPVADIRVTGAVDAATDQVVAAVDRGSHARLFGRLAVSLAP